jgi:hypothetical protein
MACTQPSRWRSWARRLRVVAAAATILTAGPSAVATIVFWARSMWQLPPSQQPQPTKQKIHPTPHGPGPGRCPAYHAYRDGKCVDVRR